MDPAQLRPLGIGEIIDAGIRIARSRFRDLAILVAVVAIPAQILQLLVSISAPSNDTTTTSFSSSGQPQVDTGDLFTQLAATLVTLVIGFVTSILATGACTEIVSGNYLGHDVGWRESLRAAWGRFFTLVGGR